MVARCAVEVQTSMNPKLTLELDQSTGQVSVNGPIDQTLFCLGMLELAKNAILDHAKHSKNQILVARPAISLVKQ
jgi:hypothetical protein